MRVYVLDASAMVAYLTAEPGGQVVRALLLDAEATCYAHSINLCEVYYDTLRGSGAQGAQQAISTSRFCEFQSQLERLLGVLAALPSPDRRAN